MVVRFLALVLSAVVLAGAVAPAAAADGPAAALVEVDEAQPTLVTDPPIVTPRPPVRASFHAPPAELAGRQHRDQIFRPPRAPR